MTKNTTIPASTSTPASNVSSADFYANEGRDDRVNSAELESKLLGDILKNSPAAAMFGQNSNDESLPDEDDDVPTPEEDANEDESAEASDAENDLDEEDQETEESDEDTSEDEEDSTQDDADLPQESDIDWEYKVPVTIDGETKYFSLEELRKGFATDQHLSQKGRELGEQRKKLDAERTEKLQELVQLGTLLHQEVSSQEEGLKADYAKLTKEIDEAREVGDTYKARELKEKREEVQEKYWKVRDSREQKLKGVVEQLQKADEERKETLIKEFNDNITTFVPEWNTKVATSIREFALKEGLPEDILENIYSPVVIKMLNEYRKLKEGTTKGQAKRKDVPVKKSVPTKKGTPANVKQQQQASNLRKTVLSGQGSKDDQLEFLKGLSSVVAKRF